MSVHIYASDEKANLLTSNLKCFSKMPNSKNERKIAPTRFQVLANHAYNGAENRLSSNRVQNRLRSLQPNTSCQRDPEAVQRVVDARE
jgi:hypothetical protein